LPARGWVEISVGAFMKMSMVDGRWPNQLPND
jgi:hypothetical protein